MNFFPIFVALAFNLFSFASGQNGRGSVVPLGPAIRTHIWDQPVWVGVPHPGSLARKLEDGSVICDCWDPRTGQKAHGDEWISNNSWKLKCNNGSTEVLACIASSRGGNEEIPLNTTKEIDGFWYKCEENNTNVRYSQEPACMVNGKYLHIGDTFRNGAFKMKCEEWGFSIAGCYYLDGDQLKELAIGQTVEVGNRRHSCEAVPEVEGRVRYDVRAIACEHEGKIYQEGEIWVTRNLKYKCGESGSYTILSCVTRNGTEIPIGQALVENNVIYKCYRLGYNVYYHAHSCGPNFGIACIPSPVPNAQFPALVSPPVIPSVQTGQRLEQGPTFLPIPGQMAVLSPLGASPMRISSPSGFFAFRPTAWGTGGLGSINLVPSGFVGNRGDSRVIRKNVRIFQK